MTRRFTRSALAAILVLAVSPLSARAQPRAEARGRARAGCDLDGGQRQRDVLEPVVLRRVLRLRPHPRRQGFLPDRHDHAQHAGAADPALARSGELAVPRLRARYARPRPGVPSRRRQARLRAGHLGAELPLPQGHVPHLQQRQRPDDAAVPCHQPRRAVDAHRDEAVVPRSVGALRRRRKGLRRVGLPRHPARRADPRSARHRARHGARDHRARRGHGRGPPPVQDPREVLPDERLVPRRDAHADRARRSPDGALGGEPGGEPRRGLRLRRGQSPGAAASRAARRPRRSRCGPATRTRRAATPSIRAASSTRRRASGGASR